MERFARALELTSAYVGISLLLMLLVATAPVPVPLTSMAAVSNATCTAPSFYSLTVAPANLNTPWNLPLLSTIDGQYTPTVVAKGLPPGITLQDQTVTLQAGGGTLHTWVLAGAPSQVGTYAIVVTAQNTCGGTSATISLPVGTAVTSQGQVCPQGTVGTYPNCTPVAGTTTTQTILPSSSTSSPSAAPSAPTVTTPPQTILPSANAAAAAQAASASGSMCIGTTATMSQGGSGGAVKALQQFLIQKGYLAAGSDTGYFGPLTRAAVAKFQLAQGIVSSSASAGYGTVGPKTRAAINAQCTSSVPQTQSRTGVICRQPTIPACPGGSPVQIGLDENGCSRGYYCASAGKSCPAVSQPTNCGVGQAPVVSSYDQNGCVSSYSCQTVEYCSMSTVTSCPAGQTLVSGTDKYGCPNVSYCQ